MTKTLPNTIKLKKHFNFIENKKEIKNTHTTQTTQTTHTTLFLLFFGNIFIYKSYSRLSVLQNLSKSNTVPVSA